MKFHYLFFISIFFFLWASAYTGTWIRRLIPIRKEEEKDLSTIQTATLTLLALFIGFSFSMALTRYDLRKNYEEGEANAIGTAYLRASLIPEQTEPLRKALRQFTELRIQFYESRDENFLHQLKKQTNDVENKLWEIASTPAIKKPSAVTGLVITSINDAINAQGYAQSAWWNRVPFEMWFIIVSIAACGNLIIGYAQHNLSGKTPILIIMPLIFSISLLLIGDIESPRAGFITVHPINLIKLAETIHARPASAPLSDLLTVENKKFLNHDPLTTSSLLDR